MGQCGPVFISYHTGSSKQLVVKISEMLEKRGIACWYAPRDVKGSYPRAIETAIRECSVFLVLLNNESSGSQHVLNEVDGAFERYNQKEDIELLPFMVADCTLSEDMHYYFRRIHIMDGATPPQELRIQELVERIAECLDIISQRHVLLAGDGEAKDYHIAGSRPVPDNLFIGRDKEIIQTIRMLTEGSGRAVLVGMGGIGKSELAKSITWRCGDAYDITMWVNFRRSILETVTDDYVFPIAGLSRDDYPSDDDMAYYRRKMRIFREIADSRVLVVVDNFDAADDDLIEDFCSGEYHILFTSRFSRIAANLPEISVGQLDSAVDQLQLFQKIYVRHLDERQLKLVEQIIGEMNGHTLGIRLAATCMRDQRLTPEKMLALLRERKTEDPRGTRAMDALLEKLDQVFRISALTAEELLLMKNLALIPLSGISVEEFCDWCGFEDFDIIDSLIRRSWIVHNPVLDRVHLHPLVSDLIHVQLNRDPECCAALVSAVSEAIRKAYETPSARKLELYGYAESICRQLPADARLLPDAQTSLALILNMLARYTESIALYEQVLHTEKDAEKRILVYARLAHSYTCAEMQEACWRCIQSGQQAINDLTQEEITEKTILASNWLLQRSSDCARRFGYYEEAVDYGYQAVAMIDGLDPQTVASDLGWSKYHYAYGLLMCGRLDESEKQLTEAIQVLTEYDKIYARAYCVGLLGQVVMCQGAYKRAVELTDACTEVLWNRPEAQYSSIGQCSMFYGNIYRRMGDEDTARMYYQKSVDAYHKFSPAKEEKVRELLSNREIRLCLDV